MGEGSGDHDRRGIFAVFLGAATIGLAPIFVRLATPATPFVVGFYRMLFAIPFVLPLALIDRSRWSGSGVRWALLAGLCFFGDLSLWHTAIHLTNASIATLFVCLAPLWVVAFASIRQGQKMRPLGFLGLALAIGGAGLLAVARGPRISFTLGLGELAGIASSFCYAGYTLCLSRARRTLSAPKALLTTILFATPLFGLAGMAVAAPFAGFPMQAWAALLGLGIVVQTLSWLVITWGFGRIDARIGALGLLVQPVATVLLGYLILRERLAAGQLVGALLVLAGIGIVSDPNRVLEKGPSRIG